MAGSWNVEQTKALIAIWGQENVQSQLDRAHRNRDVTNVSLWSWKTLDTLKRGSSAEQRSKTLPRNTDRSVVLHLLISQNVDYHCCHRSKITIMLVAITGKTGNILMKWMPYWA